MEGQPPAGEQFLRHLPSCGTETEKKEKKRKEKKRKTGIQPVISGRFHLLFALILFVSSSFFFLLCPFQFEVFIKKNEFFVYRNPPHSTRETGVRLFDKKI